MVVSSDSNASFERTNQSTTTPDASAGGSNSPASLPGFQITNDTSDQQAVTTSIPVLRVTSVDSLADESIPEAQTSMDSAQDAGSKRSSSKLLHVAKTGLLAVLKTAEIALDGLPIPAAKGCITFALKVFEKVDVS